MIYMHILIDVLLFVVIYILCISLYICIYRKGWPPSKALGGSLVKIPRVTLP